MTTGTPKEVLRPAGKLVLDYQRCTGCLACSLACSHAKAGVYDPGLARIRVLKLEECGVDAPLVCQQCDAPRCVEACPASAIARDATGILVVDDSLCTGCGNCLQACPYGAVAAVPGDNKARRTILKCDQCGGTPSCVAWCETEALKFVPADSPEVAVSMENAVLFKQRFEIEHGIKLAAYFDRSRRPHAFEIPPEAA